MVETGYREGAGVSIVRIEPLPKALGEYGNLDEQRFSNARLIAAAPELLEAVKEFMTHVYPDRVESLRHTKAIALMWAAIAKAEGR